MTNGHLGMQLGSTSEGCLLAARNEWSKMYEAKPNLGKNCTIDFV